MLKYRANRAGLQRPTVAVTAARGTVVARDSFHPARYYARLTSALVTKPNRLGPPTILCDAASRSMKTNELRELYLEFFESKGHTRCASDVLVPTWDPSVLFTPAGMNHFKDHFLGKVKLEFTRATSCQKCLRTGDIENVGRTAYHHTFFEMLGNFSFGDYFKREAILWSWEFLTSRKWLGMSPERLSVTVYKEDDEAAEIWASDVKLPANRIVRMDEDENFWPASAPSAGPDGVCGPCSEIYFHPEHGSEVEIWNLVFTQFNRVGSPPDNLRPLPSKNIDTGMGLERTAATLQGVDSNFHIDTLLPIVEAAAEVCGVKYDPRSETGRRLRRITDHVRACTFAVHENVYPGPNKEKYVVKRLLRRAVLDGHQLGMREPFLHRIVPMVVEMMNQPYPELSETSQRVQAVIENEETRFFDTIDDGLARIEAVFKQLSAAGKVTVPGEEAAELYQTYGVPPELFESMAEERQLAFDWSGFHSAMKQHGLVSETGEEIVMGDRGPIDALKRAVKSTEFLGYESVTAPATVRGIVAGEQLYDVYDQRGSEHPLILVLDRSPFYGESGGQVGDTGWVTGDDVKVRITDTQRDAGILLHVGYIESGTLRTGEQVTARVDAERREGIRRAHSATHILHHALQQQLGSHAQQQGSKVDEDWLRFDFTNLNPVDPEQVTEITSLVAEWVAADAPIQCQVLPLAEARSQGAMMLFGEKYPDPVRMVSMGDFSKELCGGTHLSRTKDVGSFEILVEEGVAAGTRRIVALTGNKAAEHLQQIEDALATAADLLATLPVGVVAATRRLIAEQRSLKKQLAGGGPGDVPSLADADTLPVGGGTVESRRAALAEVARLLSVGPLDVPDRIRAIQRDHESLRLRLAQRAAAGPLTADDLLAQAEDIDGVSVIVSEAAAAESNLMRHLIDQIRNKRSPAAILLASTTDDQKVVLVAGITADLKDRGISAGEWIRPVAAEVGGGGGGRADMAQAGGKNPAKVPAALEIARQKIRDLLHA